MAIALLIKPLDVVKHTSLSGAIDTDKIIQFIEIAQDIHLQSYTGTKLLNKIKADVIAGTLSGNYLSLTTNYLKPMLIHWTMVEFLPFHAYMISNGGIGKHTSENSETVSKFDVDFLVEKQRSLAESYSSRFVDYICYNQTLFPEYNTNTTSDIYPKNDTNLGGWRL
jgi:hypothetical protein